ncbi:hypothetical protein [Metaclostridioides mangenotii]|uniref:hypothetical protein n=1 Tax=Metaclostridioides mangenotii TaxID=1540 RepID=UPI0004878D7D|nr:hypothetical protein [Clostridioides mangenotii]
MKVEFTIPGECVSKNRPRSHNGNARTTDKTRYFEQSIKYLYGKRLIKVSIDISSEFLHNSTIVDVADYKSYMFRNAYSIVAEHIREVPR